MVATTASTNQITSKGAQCAHSTHFHLLSDANAVVNPCYYKIGTGNNKDWQGLKSRMRAANLIQSVAQLRMLLKSKTPLHTADDGHGRCAPLPFHTRRSRSSPALGEWREDRVPGTAKSAAGPHGRGCSSYVVIRRILKKKVTPARRRAFYKLCVYFRGGGERMCWAAMESGLTRSRYDSGLN